MSAPPDPSPAIILIDENSVDHAQIREMLLLTPEQRLSRVEELVESLLELRELNGDLRAFDPGACLNGNSTVGVLDATLDEIRRGG